MIYIIIHFCILEHMYVCTHMLRSANQLIEKPKSVCSSEIHITGELYCSVNR